jgi:hypothetical protein
MISSVPMAGSNGRLAIMNKQQGKSVIGQPAAAHRGYRLPITSCCSQKLPKESCIYDDEYGSKN